MIADIDVAILKCLNFVIIEKKRRKNKPPTRLLVPKSKKAQKCVFFAAGLSKVIEPKNKKTLKSVCFLFYIYVTFEKLTAYAKF